MKPSAAVPFCVWVSHRSVYVQKPWAKPAGNPAAQLQRAAASESRPIAHRAFKPSQRNVSLTTSLPAIKIESCVRQLEEANATVNPLFLVDSSGVTPKGASRQPSLVCFAQTPSASFSQVYMLVCSLSQKPHGVPCHNNPSLTRVPSCPGNTKLLQIMHKPQSR